MIIDSHVHLYPPELNVDAAGWAAVHEEPHWATLCMRRRADGRPAQTFPSMEELLREMDGAGIARVVLLGWYWQKPETCAWQNRFFGRCVRAHPDRFMAFATLHPRAGHWPTLQEMHCARDEGLIGIGELSPHSQGYALDDGVFEEVLTLAADWKMPVNLHVTDPDGPAYPGRVETPLADFTKLARAFPQVTFILAHWGGLLPLRDAGALQFKNLFYDTAASPLTYDASIWRRFVDTTGPDCVLFGSDYPLNLYPKLDAAPTMSRLIGEARTALGEPRFGQIASDTASRLLTG